MWYERWFPGQLLTTDEGPKLSKTAATVIEKLTKDATGLIDGQPLLLE